MGRKRTLTDEERKQRKMERYKIYRENNKDKERERGKIYRENNKDKERERLKRWIENNKERWLEYRKKRKKTQKTRSSNGERLTKPNCERLTKKEYDKRYRSTKKGRAQNLVCRYRQSDKMYGRDECLITAQWIIDNIFNGQTCVYCGETDWHKLGCDRIDNTKPHTPDNVVCSCGKCNIKKGRRTYFEFLSKKGEVA